MWVLCWMCCPFASCRSSCIGLWGGGPHGLRGVVEWQISYMRSRDLEFESRNLLAHGYVMHVGPIRAVDATQSCFLVRAYISTALKILGRRTKPKKLKYALPT